MIADLTKGCFRISGKEIGKLSVHQISAKAENAGSTIGCGHEGCLITLDEAWYANVIESIFCFSCYPTLHAIDPHQGCPTHQETKLTNLVLNSLGVVAKHHLKLARKIINSGIPIPHHMDPKGPITPILLHQALAWSKHI